MGRNGRSRGQAAAGQGIEEKAWKIRRKDGGGVGVEETETAVTVKEIREVASLTPSFVEVSDTVIDIWCVSYKENVSLKVCVTVVALLL